MRQRFFFVSYVLCIFLTILSAHAGVTILPLCENDRKLEEFEFVGKIVNFNNGISGSVVFINNGNHFITSKHCVTHDGKPEGMLLDATNFVVQQGEEYFLVSRMHQNSHCDLAIGELYRPAKRSVKLLNGQLYGNESFYGAGYGMSCTKTDTEILQFDIEYGTKRIFKNTLQGSFEDYYPTLLGNLITAKIHYFNLRRPGSPCGNPIQGEGIPGPGDSGGGLFIDNNGSLELFAVIFAVQTHAPFFSYAVDLYTQKKWIESICPQAFSTRTIVLCVLQSDEQDLHQNKADFSTIYGFYERKKLRVVKV